MSNFLLLSCRFWFRSINNFLSTLFLLFPLFVIARNFVVEPGGGIIVVLKIIMDCKPIKRMGEEKTGLYYILIEAGHISQGRRLYPATQSQHATVRID
jgi:hypothetical protein